MTLFDRLDARLGELLEGTSGARGLDLVSVERKAWAAAIKNASTGPSGVRELPGEIIIRISPFDQRQHRERLQTHADRVRQLIVIAAAENGIVEPEPLGLRIMYRAEPSLVAGDFRVVVTKAAQDWTELAAVPAYDPEIRRPPPRDRLGAIRRRWPAVQAHLTYVSRRVAALTTRAALAALLGGVIGGLGGILWASVEPAGPLWVEALYLTNTGRLAEPDLARGELLPPEVTAWLRQCRNDPACIQAGIREARESKVRDLRHHYESALGRPACEREIRDWIVEVDRYKLSRHDLVQKVRLSDEAKEFARTGRPRIVDCAADRK